MIAAISARSLIATLGLLAHAASASAECGGEVKHPRDLPNPWYLRHILAKVEAQWNLRKQFAEKPPQRPQVCVEILRDGTIRPPTTIEVSSGDPAYDEAARRSVIAASPFAPLPEDWRSPSLQMKFRFDFPVNR